MPETIERAGRNAAESGGSFTCVHDMEEAFRDADVVYPKSWAPYAVMKERTELLRADSTDKLDQLEARCLAENERHRRWECDDAQMSVTRAGRALYLHCLPADISGVSCARGEVSATVFERFRDATYRQAGRKPFVIAALMLLARVAGSIRVLRELGEGQALRRPV
jgi:ornithine carbamoyltransferase